ncbi:MAG TPA: phosphatase PAP2 family protein [Gemmatimonadales bacterium]|nr:phosphatase PAP2 family protein [Gemmatimonadales bacterium]
MFRHAASLLGLALLTAAGSVAAQDAPYRVGWPDAAVIAGGGVLALLPIPLHLPSGTAPCAPCDPAGLWSVDRIAVHLPDRTADRASTLLLLGVGGAAGLGTIWGEPRDRAVADAVVFTDAVVWAATANQWLKVAVHRSRPILYTSEAPAAANIRDNRESFPSGHAELAFAAATAYAVIARRRHLPHATRNAILLYTGAAIVSALRVTAGKHFPTDVLGGALLGSAVSWTVATVHP